MTQVSALSLTDIEPSQVATEWLERFSVALAERDVEALLKLVRSDAYWRDIVSFTGHIRTLEGGERLVASLISLADRIQPHGFRLSDDQTPPSVQLRGLEQTIELFFDFETADTLGKGIVRLTAADTELGVQAWALMTAAQELKGLEDPIGPLRRDHALPSQFSGPNWKEHLDNIREFEGRDPEVVVVGAGQCGLTVAAKLRLMGVDVLTIEKHDRVGDNWRNRYHSLTLHNQQSVNKLPYMSFPTTWPEYFPKDMFGGWLETFADSLEVPSWLRTSLKSGVHEQDSGLWTLTVIKDGVERQLRTQHVVLATGGSICALPNRPVYPGIEKFEGPILHSSEVSDTDQFAGKQVLVFGTGTSAHDIATQLTESGASVTMVQRNSANVLSLETANLYLTMFNERAPEEVDLIFNANSMNVNKQGFTAMTAMVADLDRELTTSLEAVGFRTNNGIDDAGYFWNFLERGGGYYLNVGGSDMIISGLIKVIQESTIETFTETGMRLSDGQIISVDAAVFATGYGNQSEQIGEFFGAEVADRVGAIWGYGDDGEIRNTWRPTPEDGLWLVGGAVSHARNFGRYVALQIKARLDGKITGTDLSSPTLWV
jgi:putative flavoprotein involved in K+ transport